MDETTVATEAVARFNHISWIVIALYIAATTWLGAKLAGKQATIRDFFLGGRKLPWYAVSGSIIATELSAMTLVGVPAFLWAESGNMAYAALAIGGLFARIIVAWKFIPKFYEQEIYSPYDYIGNQLGKRANSVTSALFMLGGILGQGTRVLLTAIVLDVVIDFNTPWPDIYICIWIVGFVSVIWTLLGGITTVIWTDVIQFLVFTFSAIFTLCLVIYEFELAPGTSFNQLLKMAWDNNKFFILDTNFDSGWLARSFDIRENYNLGAAAVATTLGGLAAYGTDQMMAQRIFCCKNMHEARKAIIVSWASQILMYLCLLTGVALWAFYRKSGIEGVPNPIEAAEIAENPNRLIPVFVKFRVPAIVGGLIVAGIFAAAISSLDSILAALSQQTLAAVHRGRHHSEGEMPEHQNLRLSRFFIVFWGFVLCAIASIMQVMWSGKGLLVELALSIVGLTQGAILGAFLMALFPALRRKARGLEWAALLSIMTIFALAQKPGKVATDTTEQTGIYLRSGEWSGFQVPGGSPFSQPFWEAMATTWTFWLLVVVAAITVITAVLFRMKQDKLVIIKMLPYLALIIFLQLFQYQDDQTGAWRYLTTGWPWYAPIGATIMLTAALLLCDRPDREDKSPSASKPIPANQ